jgi:hypothetical protein
MKNIVSITLILLSTTLVSAEEAQPFNMATKIGTLGVGFDISTPINEKLSARFNLNGASYTDTQDNDGNEFEGTLDLMTVGALLDYYPFKNSFRLTTGVYYNANEFTGVATPSETINVELNGVEYTSDDLAKVDTAVMFDKFAPYVGIGWGNNAENQGWGFTFDLGVMYHGEADVSLIPDVKSQDLRKILEINLGTKKEEQNIEDELADYKLYPVVMLGVNYSF